MDADPQSTATMILGLKPVAEPRSFEPIELFIRELAVGSITLVRGGPAAPPREREAARRIGRLYERGGVACLLLICIANVSTMQLARGASRQREFAIRTAIGAPRGRNL